MTTAKSERIHIGFFGRTNVGKSSIINLISNQDISIVSDIAGTTTDAVEKVMELAPVGAVVLIDTAGIDDMSVIAYKRKKKTNTIFRKCDFACLVVVTDIWTEYEENIINNFRYFNIPFSIIINKIDIVESTNEFHNKLTSYTKNIICISTINTRRSVFINSLTDIISKELVLRDNEIGMFNGLLNAGDVCLFITPIDSGAPKGRMILPQVQALRAILDINAICLFGQVAEYKKSLSELIKPPKLVVTDSQSIKEIVELSLPDQNVTTFSILLARMKGDFKIESENVYTIESITPSDTILIAEACSHHAQKEDIARVKFPKLLEKYLGFKPLIEYCNGRDYSDNINKYKLIIHCGACMLTNREKRNRVKIAVDAYVPITNFGMALSFLNGYIDRVLQPFKDII
jgi:[FeFe] hydrogenase H-cluster maturation GTPase HydF